MLQSVVRLYRNKMGENRPLEQEINERLNKSFYKGARSEDLVDRKQYVYDLPSEMMNYLDEIN